MLNILLQIEPKMKSEIDVTWKKLKINSRNEFIRQCIQRGLATLKHD